jgi:hypothetical protein
VNSRPISRAMPCSIPPPAAGWLSVVKPSDGNQVAELSAKLDTGEAIVLAQAIGSDLLLMDERKGVGSPTRWDWSRSVFWAYLLTRRGAGTFSRSNRCWTP